MTFNGNAAQRLHVSALCARTLRFAEEVNQKGAAGIDGGFIAAARKTSWIALRRGGELQDDIARTPMLHKHCPSARGWSLRFAGLELRDNEKLVAIALAKDVSSVMFADEPTLALEEEASAVLMHISRLIAPGWERTSLR